MLKTIKKLVLLVIVGCLFSNCGVENKTSEHWEPIILKKFKKEGITSNLPDYSYAGYMYGEKEIPTVEEKTFNVEDFGAKPNDGVDDTKAINKTIQIAGENGGGIVFFPKGTFHVNMDATKTEIVQINYSNIVMRGSGSKENGTVIFSGNSTSQENSAWLSPFAFHSGLNIQGTDKFFDVGDLEIFTTISKDAKAGAMTIEVEKVSGLNAGDIILIALRNTTDDGNLINELMHPLKFEPFQKSYLEAGPIRAASFQYPIEIDEIVDATHIKLKQPLRRDVPLKFEPTISMMPMLKNVGVEHFKFESAWDGNYKHHRTTEETYGWGSINLQRVSHGWIRDIHIDNFTQTIHLVNSRNVTVENVIITGKEGHYSPKMYHSSDNLVQNFKVESKVTHGPGLEGCSFGNVYRNLNYAFPSPIDLHGSAGSGFCPPMYNLFENMVNISRIAGGGAPQNIPHSGEYNTFWNIEMQGWEDEGFHEIFVSWIWRDPVRFENEMHIDCHKQYLRSNLIGIRSSNPDYKLSIEHSFEDRSDEWIYVEELNTNKNLGSLYDVQLKLRLQN